MASIYYKKSGDNLYYTNENKTGYYLYVPYNLDDSGSATEFNALKKYCPSYERNVIIELYNNKFILPSDSRWLFFYSTNTEFNDMDKWDFSEVRKMNGFFSHSNLRTFDVSNLSNWDTSRVTGMGNFFEGSRYLDPIVLTNFDTSSATNMAYMFKACRNVKSLDVSGFNTSNVTNMRNMFENCGSFTSLDVSSLDTSNVTRMDEMFRGSNIEILDLSTFDVSNVQYFSWMFSDATSRIIILSGWDLSSATEINRMFQSCKNLEHILVYEGTDWELSYPGILSSAYMFYDCRKLPGWDGTVTITKANNTKGGYFGKQKKWDKLKIFIRK